jgi:hypothetical protein
MDDKQFDHVAREFDRLFAATVVPVAGVVDKRVFQYGTGTLFQIGERRFLVTAAHVVNKANQQRARLHIPDCLEGDAQLISLHGLAGYGGDSPLDVVAVELPEKIAAQMPKRRFLRQAEITHDEDSALDVFYLFGFPGSFSAPMPTGVSGICLHGIGILTDRYSESTERFGAYDARLHVLCNMPEPDQTHAHGVPFPQELRGISGACLWRVTQGGPFEDWTADQIRAAAVQTAVYQENNSRRAIQSTRWGVVSAMIQMKYEDLRPSFRLQLP